MRLPLLLFLVAVGCTRANEPASSAAPSAPPAADDKPSAEPPVEASNALAEKVDALFTKAAKEGSFTGTIVVVDDAKTVLTKAYGQADRKTNRANGKDTIFRIGSLSKQFTAAAILALADEGKLAVTDPLSRFLPEYTKESLVKDGVEVTLHHLLSHTSGLADADKTPYFKSNAWTAPIDKAALIEATKDLPLVRKPGTKFEYLNYGYFLLALVVERVSEKDYETFMHERLFAPLGMSDTGTLFPPEKQDRGALGYFKTKAGTFLTMADDPTFKDRDLTLAFGSGQIYSTVGDLALWDRALADGRVKGQDLLFRPNLDDYGYGWSIEKKNGVDYVWHNGALSPLGFSSYLVRVPSKKRMVAYLSNLDIDLTMSLEDQVANLAVE